jgi:hypothetical protein
MRQIGLLLIAGAIGAVATLCVGAVAPVPSQGSSEIEQIKQEVAALRQRVAALEEQLKDGWLSAAMKEAKTGVINPSDRQRPVPPSWKKGEFNGVPYYIVPIDKARTPVSNAQNQAAPSKTPPAPKAPDEITKP